VIAVDRAAVAWTASGAAATVALVLLVTRPGGSLAALAIFGLVVFSAIVAGFMYVPWVTVALVIPLYAIVPTLKVFVHPALGGLKDLVSIAAVAAAALLVVQRRYDRRPIRLDNVALVLFGLIVSLYVTNIGGNLSGESGYGASWYQGVRLFCVPLSLLVVGMLLRDPRRTFRAGAISLIATTAAVALIGLAQQAIGVDALLAAGYEYGEQVRQIGTRLRSFGTLAEPFAYTSFLLVGLSVLLMWSRRGPLMYLVASLLAVGVVVSFVRTAAVIAIALLGLALARGGQKLIAATLLSVAVIAAVSVLVATSGRSTTRTVAVSPTTYLTLNGRTKLWQSQVGGSATDWLFGRGVGATGTAAARAEQTLTGRKKLNSRSSAGVVDSGYLAVVADIGVAGLILLLALFGLLLTRAVQRARGGDALGWAAVGILAVTLLDGLSRESFTGFPTAYVAMLLVGLAVARGSETQAADLPLRA
jgi:O-antigen ligase